MCAKIKYSALVQEMRNKLNGSVASRNRYGNYWRNKTTPVNPQTAFQQNQRARLSAVSQAWGGLTASQRQSFTNLAQDHPFIDILGDQHRYDGKAMFSKLNLNLLSAGQPQIVEALPFGEIPFIQAISAENDVAGDIAINVSVEAVPAGSTLIVQATPPLPATINFVKNRYRSLGSSVVADNIADVTAAYSDRFGAITSADVGKRVHYRVFVVDNATGQSSIASEVSAVVGE